MLVSSGGRADDISLKGEKLRMYVCNNRYLFELYLQKDNDTLQ